MTQPTEEPGGELLRLAFSMLEDRHALERQQLLETAARERGFTVGTNYDRTRNVWLIEPEPAEDTSPPPAGG